MATGLQRAFVADVAAAGVRPVVRDGMVTDADLAGLPPTARRYLGWMRVAGRPRVWSFGVRMRGRFRLRPGLPWARMDAWQYNLADPVTRVYTIRLVLAGLPMLGHDTYVGGVGRMHGTLLGVLPVVDGRGPELDSGELTTFLNDAVLLAPSMLLTPAVAWRDLDDRRFEVALTDAGRTVRAVVEVDGRGAPVDFVTTDRFADLPGGLVRAEWRTPVPGWDLHGGVPFPRPGCATWLLPEGPFTYVEGGFLPGTFRGNVGPPRL